MPDSSPATTSESDSSADSAAHHAAMQAAQGKFPWRAFLIGLPLIPISVYWIEMTEVIVHAADLAAMSLVMASIGFLILLVMLNRLIQSYAPKHALSQAELMLIYIMSATTVGLCGIGGLQFLVSTLAAPEYFKSSANHWDQWIYYLRPWAFPDKSAIADFYAGRSSLLSGGHLTAWLAPICIWSIFIFVMTATMYCIATLFRRQWVERERLLFPLIAIPLEISRNGGDAPIFKTKAFWSGAGLTVLMEVLATLHYTVSPGIPYIPIKPNESLYVLNTYITTPPWNGIGNLDLAIYPMVVGIAYLLSLDVSFSVWFFYILLKLEDIGAVAFGFKDPGAPAAIARVPYPDQQCAGAFTGLALMAIYYAWPHLKQAFKYAFFPHKSPSDMTSDLHEPLSYRSAFIGLFLGMAFLIAFAMMLGISLIVSLVFMALYMMWALTMTRIRAEAGLPWGTGPGQFVHGTVVDTASSSQFSTQELTGIICLKWVDSDFRTLEMQQQMEAMKIADSGLKGDQLLNPRHMTKAIAAAVVLAVITGWLTLLSIYYKYGASSATVDYWRTQVGNYNFEELQTWITSPAPFDAAALQWIGIGSIVSIALSFLRASFAWFPLNPIGYAVSLTGLDMDWIWFPIFLGWLFKRLIIRYGGLKAYRNALPFFIGLVVGDYFISAVLALLANVLQAMGLPSPGYRTFPI